MFQAKDFIATADGLLFAVVADGIEHSKVLCFLRYAQLDGQWLKLSTEQANRLLAEYFPGYLHYSPLLDASLHAVPIADVCHHYRPRIGLQALLQADSDDPVIADLQTLCRLLQDRDIEIERLGVTGSLLVGRQHEQSDIDLVCYGRKVFHRTRAVLQQLVEKQQCSLPDEQEWLNSYHRRSCDLSLDEYVWHERRKFNKGVINRRKFDLNLLEPAINSRQGFFQKMGAVVMEVDVVDDFFAFDYPAQFHIDHPTIDSVVCFTATYTGQAQAGERIAVAGMLERSEDGRQRIVVGSTREAGGEYIKVVR